MVSYKGNRYKVAKITKLKNIIWNPTNTWVDLLILEREVLFFFFFTKAYNTKMKT